MGFWTGIIKAGTTVFETEQDVIDKKNSQDSDITEKDNDIKEIIMIDPMAMELLKCLSNLKKNEENAEKGVFDSKTEKELNKYKTKSINNKTRSLNDMTEILEKGSKIKGERE